MKFTQSIYLRIRLQIEDLSIIHEIYEFDVLYKIILMADKHFILRLIDVCFYAMLQFSLTAEYLTLIALWQIDTWKVCKENKWEIIGKGNK